MKTTINFMNRTTGELTDNHDIAMDWYRDGDEVSLITYSDVLGEWIERGYWAH